MRFLTLGTGTALPDPDRGPAAFAVQAEGRSWLVDGGGGAIGRLARAGLDPLTLAGGVLSHRHLDHSGELAPLLFSFRVAGREAPYPLVGGEGLIAHLDALRAVYGRWLDFPGGLAPIEVPLDRPHALDLGPLRLRTAPAVHGAGALHLRFEHGGRAVVFSGDTAPSEALVALATGADLLVCECGGDDAEDRGEHLAPRDVVALVARARPRAVWLTHFYPGTDPEAAVARVAATGVPTRRAADGDAWPA